MELGSDMIDPVDDSLISVPYPHYLIRPECPVLLEICCYMLVVGKNFSNILFARSLLNFKEVSLAPVALLVSLPA